MARQSQLPDWGANAMPKYTLGTSRWGVNESCQTLTYALVLGALNFELRIVVWRKGIAIEIAEQSRAIQTAATSRYQPCIFPSY